MSKVGQIERATQNRIVQLFQEQLQYDYLGNWEDRENNSNIEESELRKYLKGTGKYSDELITKAIFALKKEANINTNDATFRRFEKIFKKICHEQIRMRIFIIIYHA